MSDVVIRVENLGKKYRIRHQRTERYTALRDVIANSLSAPWRSLASRFRNAAGAKNGNDRSLSALGSPLHAPRSEPKGASFSECQSASVSSPPEEDFWALRDVSFEVRRGEVLGIIGRNGAGKSTLLKILSRITEPTTGQIEIDGRVASLLEVGTGFHPELTGRENIYLNGAILGMTRAEIRKNFDKIVEFAEIERFLDTPIKRYSSGMYVRLAFAVAAHLEPEILIVDEVLAVGDDKFQQKCLGKMRSVSESGRTVLFVSHQLGMLRQLCDRAIWMTDGRANSFDSMTDALRKYLDDQGAISTEVDQRSKHVTSIRMGNGGLAGSHVFFGETFSITTTLRNLPRIPIGLTVDIKNDIGKRLCLLATNPNDGVVLPQKSEFDVTLVMNSCCLAPGQYFVDVAVTEPGVRIIEEVGNALRFEIHPARVGGSLPYDSRFGEFFPPHSWKVAS